MKLSREQYDASSRINWSTLKLMGRSPAHYRERIDHPPGPDTDAMAKGRIIHLAALEPEQLEEVAIWEEGVRRGKAWDAFVAANRGRELVTRATYDEALAIGASARRAPMAVKYLNDGEAEVSLSWAHETPPLDCKGRVDFVANCGALVDLKSTRDASPAAFARQCHSLEYHAQAAFYVDGYLAEHGKALPFVVVAVETVRPYAVQVYEVPEELLELGRERYRTLLDTLNHCRTHDEWPAYGTAPMPLTLPAWAMPRDDENADNLGVDFGA